MKYIKTTTNDFILFLPPITHIGMAKSLGFEIDFIESAGFVKIEDGQYKCFGQSDSLGIESGPDDSEELNCFAETCLRR